jgi:hypothetical protein
MLSSKQEGFVAYIVTLATYTILLDAYIKLNLSKYTPRRHLEERRYSPYSIPTSALDGRE